MVFGAGEFELFDDVGDALEAMAVVLGIVTAAIVTAEGAVTTAGPGRHKETDREVKRDINSE